MTEAQQLAIRWLDGEDVPDWCDTPRLNTLKALERRGLVSWTTDGSRCYWVTPQTGTDQYLDHWHPRLTKAGLALAHGMR